MKHICKRDLLRNAAKSLDDQPTIVTNHGQPEYFVSKIDSVQNLAGTIASLQAFQSSLNRDGTDNSEQDFSHMADYSSKSILRSSNLSNPIITKGGQIKYEKKHSHK